MRPCSIWSELLGVTRISIYDNFFKLGGDSIISIQLIAKSRQKGIYITIKDIFNQPTIKDLALIAQKNKNISIICPSQEIVSGDIPLTPIQHWFFEQNFPQENHYNQSIILKINKKLSPKVIKKAFQFLLNHHDILRAKYNRKTSKESWSQTYSDSYTRSFFSQVNLTHDDNQSLSQTIYEHSNHIQESLDIKKGVLFKGVLFCCDKLEDRLLIVVHHLVIDGVSWRILLDDLQQICDSLLNKNLPKLPPKTHSYAQWAKALENYSNSVVSQFPYWKETELSLTPLNLNKKVLTPSKTSFETISWSLDPDQTRLLIREAPKALDVEVQEILLTALILAVSSVTNRYELSLTLEGHGREDIIPEIDISRTLGWFTSLYPLTLKISKTNNLIDTIEDIKKQFRSIPHKGVGYSILKYLSKSSLQAPLPSFTFNYLGQWDNIFQKKSIFSYSQESTGNEISLKNLSSTSLSLNAGVQGAIFSVSWYYNAFYYNKKTIKKIGDLFIKQLLNILMFSEKTLTCDYSNKFNWPDNNTLGQSQSLWIKQIKKIITPLEVEGKKPNIFFIHPIGGNTYWYKDVCKSLSSGFNGYGIQSIFIDNQENLLLRSIEEMSSLYIKALLEIQKDGSYIIAGWSFGGKIAYEISKKMIAKGYNIISTIIIDESPNTQHNKINQYIKNYESNNTLLKDEKELLIQYNHYKILKKYKIKGKINNIILFNANYG